MADEVPAPLRQSKLADQLYEQILAKIVSGALPEGGKLPSEGQLCELFGVSRPVVREALSQLQEQGLVQNRERRGMFVTQMSPQEVEHMFALRMLLEGEVVRLAATQMPPAIPVVPKSFLIAGIPSLKSLRSPAARSGR